VKGKFVSEREISFSRDALYVYVGQYDDDFPPSSARDKKQRPTSTQHWNRGRIEERDLKLTTG